MDLIQLSMSPKQNPKDHSKAERNMIELIVNKIVASFTDLTSENCLCLFRHGVEDSA